MANKKHKKSNNHNMDMLSNVRKSSLRALFPNFDECELQTKLLTLFFAYRDEPLFMNSNYPYAKEIIDELYIIMNSRNADDVRKSFYTLYKKGFNYEKLLSNLFDVIEDRYKYEYVNKFSKRYYPSGIFVDKNGKKYNNVVDITNEDFYLFLHNISVGYIDRIGAINITMFPSLFIDNTNEGGDSICGSVVSSDFMGCPRNYRMLVNGDGVYYGFNLKDNDELIAVGNSSLSDIANKRFSGDKNLNDYYLYAMFAPNDLPINITDYYGEGRIYRKCQGEKRKPDYILCFDEINNDAVRHAEYYNIPIYFINRVGLLKKQVAKILNEFEQLKSCDNISLNQVEKYFNRLSSFSYELMYCEYFLDYSDNEIQELIGVLKELYAASSEFIDKHLRRLIKNSNKVERITINNLTNKNSRTPIAIDDLSKRLHMSSKLNNFESIGNISVGDTRSLIDDLKGMLDREKDL